MKKTLKLGLAVLAASSITSAAYADVIGRVTSYATSVSVKTNGESAGSYQDMDSDARFGWSDSKKVGDWTASVKLELDIEENSSSITHRDRYVSVAKGDLEYRLGRQFVGSTSVGRSYVGRLENTPYVGEELGRDDYFSVNMSDLGLSVALGLNKQNDSTYGDYKETALGAWFAKEISSELTVKASYVSRSWSLDKKLASYNSAAETSVYKGGGKTELAAAGQFTTGNTTAYGELNILTALKGASTSKDITTTTMVLGVDQKLDDDSGVSIIYSNASDNEENVNTKTSVLHASYSVKLGAATTYVIYDSKSTKNDGTTDDNTTTAGVGMIYGF